MEHLEIISPFGEMSSREEVLSDTMETKKPLGLQSWTGYWLRILQEPRGCGKRDPEGVRFKNRFSTQYGGRSAC